MIKWQAKCLAGMLCAGLGVSIVTSNASQAFSQKSGLEGEAFTANVLTDIKRQHAGIFSDANLSEEGVLTIETTRALNADDELAAKLVTAGDRVRLEVVGGPTNATKQAAIEAVAGAFYGQPGVDAGIVTYDETTEQVIASYAPMGGTDITFGPSEVLGIPVVYRETGVAPPRAL